MMPVSLEIVFFESKYSTRKDLAVAGFGNYSFRIQTQEAEGFSSGRIWKLLFWRREKRGKEQREEGGREKEEEKREARGEKREEKIKEEKNREENKRREGRREKERGEGREERKNWFEMLRKLV